MDRSCRSPSAAVNAEAQPPAGLSAWFHATMNAERRRHLARLSWCLIGMAVGVSLALWCVGPPASPFLLASLGGSAVFLFGLTKAPAAQPRSLLGGHLGGAFIGIACYQCLGDALPVYALAQVLTLAWMMLARTMHPPAGANPMLMIHVHAGWSTLWVTVLPGLLALLSVAVVWSRLYPGMHRYPVSPLAPSPPSPFWGGWD
jgi:CBS-domain-containing membrane protein